MSKNGIWIRFQYDNGKVLMCWLVCTVPPVSMTCIRISNTYCFFITIRTLKWMFSSVSMLIQHEQTVISLEVKKVKPLAPLLTPVTSNSFSYLLAIPPYLQIPFPLVFLTCKYLSSLSKPCIFDCDEYLKLHMWCWNVSRPLTSIQEERLRPIIEFCSFSIQHKNDCGKVELGNDWPKKSCDISFITSSCTKLSCTVLYQSNILSLIAQCNLLDLFKG